MNLPKIVYCNQTVPDIEVLYYIWLDDGIVNSKTFLDSLYGKDNYSNKLSRLFTPTINALNSRGLINAEKTGRGIYKINKINEGAFAIIRKKDVQKIINSPNKDALQLVRYYCWLAGSMNKGESSIPISYFADMMECSDRTIIRYNSKLEEMGIIKIKHQGKYKQHNVYMLT